MKETSPATGYGIDTEAHGVYVNADASTYLDVSDVPKTDTTGVSGRSGERPYRTVPPSQRFR